MKKRMIIALDSCNGEEEQFQAWMNENYPEIETVIENTDNGGLYVWSEEYQEWQPDFDNDNYWDLYCLYY